VPGRPDRLKVIHVASRLNAGGLAVQVLNACSELNRRGWDCSVAAGRAGADEAEMREIDASWDKVFIHDIADLGRKIRPWSDLSAIWHLYRLFRREHPSVVHTHASKAGVLGRIAARLARIPVVVHSFHGHVFRYYFPPIVSRLIVWIERLLGRLTDAVVLPCESLAMEMAEEFRIIPHRKARIVRYGIDVGRFCKKRPSRRYARKNLGIPEDALVVGAVGRLAPIKDHAMLISAFNRLPPSIRNRDVRLLVHGDGECRQEIEGQIRDLRLTNRVHFIPWAKDLRVLYAALDILAITSKSEGMPISAIEAMASDVLVVARAVGGVPDLIQDFKTGRLAHDHSPEGFYALLHVHLERNDGKNEYITEKAFSFVQENHPLSALGDDTEALYRELLEIPA